MHNIMNQTWIVRDIVIHILDMMVDKYFEFVYTIEDKTYNFEDAHVDDTQSKK